MNTKPLIPIAGTWLVSLGAAYYIGQHNALEKTTSKAVEATSQATSQATTSRSSLSRPNSEFSNQNSENFVTPANAASGSTPDQGNSPQSPLSIEEIQKITNPLERSRQLLALIDSYNAEDFSNTLEAYSSRSLTDAQENEKALLLSAWAKLDPAGALEFAQKDNNSEDSTKYVLASWAATSPEAAIAWARENHKGDSANPWLTGVIQGIAGNNPTLATSLLQELPYSQERGEALQALIPHIAGNGAAASIAWINNIQDKRLQDGAARYLADYLAGDDPAAAAQWANSLDSQSQRLAAIPNIMSNWASEDLDAAKDWLDSLPAAEQDAAAPNFMSAYANEDLNAAADWLDTQGESANYQTLLATFASHAVSTDPVMALNYGNELEDDRSRSRYVGRALWTLYRQDKASAREWIQNNDVPERVQRYVNRMMDN